MNEFLQETFGSEALTFEQFNEKLDNEGIKLVNAAGGSYVPKADYDAVNSQLSEAQGTENKSTKKRLDGILHSLSTKNVP